MKKKVRGLTFVQKRVAEVRAERIALLERAAAARHAGADEQHGQLDAVKEAVKQCMIDHERPLHRGEVEPEVVVAADGTVCLAPLEWSTVASDMTEQ